MNSRRSFLKCLVAVPFLGLVKPKNDYVPVLLLPGENVVSKKTFNLYSTHIQHINVNIELTREQLSELGRKVPYYRYISFPVKKDL